MKITSCAAECVCCCGDGQKSDGRHDREARPSPGVTLPPTNNNTLLLYFSCFFLFLFLYQKKTEVMIQIIFSPQLQ